MPFSGSAKPMAPPAPGEPNELPPPKNYEEEIERKDTYFTVAFEMGWFAGGKR